ncbi:hypothetical protein GCM10010277_69280 [Streptomyces longisporoflavus]|uniref:DUF6302 family protein n=1 Tax=Streptomyces longisporoflavus TaxID=28044 RepID=UPI00167E7A9E|nr:DUF6302 family protein [Streptomyces longisporoflavus]GGV63268.1 hypothetical protein GCM10010277_69280 [Streptomyces longisporoflavus]
MSSPHVYPPAPLTIAPAQEAYDYELFEQRLANPWLLKKSIAVRALRMPFLLVPVGGSRQGGYFSVPYLHLGLLVRDLVLAQPGFPDPRLRWSPYPDTCHIVEWGARPPAYRGPVDDITLGRFYGYSEQAIARFVNRAASTPRTPQPPSPAPPPRSPAAP